MEDMYEWNYNLIIMTYYLYSQGNMFCLCDISAEEGLFSYKKFHVFIHIESSVKFLWYLRELCNG